MTRKSSSGNHRNHPGTDQQGSTCESRRGFLRTISSVAASGSAAALCTSPALAKGVPNDSKLAAGITRVRSVAARAVRVSAAVNQFSTPTTFNKANNDESDLPGFVGNFSKSLPHNSVGEVDPEVYRALRTALKSRGNAEWENVRLSAGATQKLANPQASLAYSLAGGDSHAFFMPPAPEFSSARQASEMAEVYLHALLRDVPFDEFSGDPLAAIAASELNTFSDFSGPTDGSMVTPGTLFRGPFSGSLTGNYVSQFLLMPVPQGAGLMEQRYQTTTPGDNHMGNRSDWLNILRGGTPTTANQFENAPRYITTARDLGEYVHRDYPYQTYLQAALILLGMDTPRQQSNPYNSNATQQGFVTHGDANLLAQLGEVADHALKAAWYQKWQVHRRLRPEVFAGRVHFTMTGERAYSIHPELLNSPILDALSDTMDSGFWLPMAYPEGSPTHPAYPAGHAVVAGACVTVLKAFFDGASTIAQPLEVVPGLAGASLQPYTGDETLTVEGELNKLANNIAIGRNLAGVHWRTDGTEGILLGEEVAVRMLRDSRLTYNEQHTEIRLVGFAGNTINI